MKKLIAAIIATAFASGVAFAQDKKMEENKADAAKPAAAAPAKKDAAPAKKEAAPAAKKEAAPAKKEAAPAAKKEEMKTEAKK
jgi:hypothetical protein